VAPPGQPAAGFGGIDQRHPAARPDHPGELGEHRTEVDEVPEREPARHTVDGTVRYGEAQGVALHDRRRGAPGGQHPEGEVDTDGDQPGMCQVVAEVARPAGDVEHGRAGREPQGADGLPAPADVQAEGHDPVDQVVPRRDPVEHRPHRPRLVLTL
jgi:hypothetical protein